MNGMKEFNIAINGSNDEASIRIGEEQTPAMETPEGKRSVDEAWV